MTPQEFQRRIAQHKQDIELLMRRRLPILVGNMAKRHFTDNFRKGGFDGKPWKVTWRQLHGRGAASQYGPLLSSRNHLMGSIQYVAGDAYVTLYTKVPYAKIHNEGGSVDVPVTRKMKKFFWAKFYEEGGNQSASDIAEFWKKMALTKKNRLHINILQRKFLGESADLNKKITDKIDDELWKILNS